MKRNINKLFLLLLFPVLLLQQSCIEETFDAQNAHSKHVSNSDTALEALSNATSAFMFKYNNWNSYSYVEFGYPAQMISMDALCGDVFVSTATGGYDYFRDPWGSITTTLGSDNSSRTYIPWRFYYTLIMNAHSIIFSFDEAPDDTEHYTQQQREFYGVASVFRALAYMDLMRRFEYKRTGISEKDSEADAKDLWGLTVNIVNEYTEDLRNNPRAPFYEMYRFILTDLNRAERYLADYKRASKNKPDLSVVYGYKARLWLEIATRFQKDSESSYSKNDLQTMLSHENDEELAMYDKLGVSSIQECYQKAAEYARKAINLGLNSPLTQEQWHDKLTGFNSATANNSWMFGVLLTPEGIGAQYYNFIACFCAEYSLGMGNTNRRAWRRIDKNLYDRIDDADWRKTTWIAPEDAGVLPIPEKYSTVLAESDWQMRVAYTGLKYRVKDGNQTEYKTACAADIPLMRIEEMYFIEAEALTYTEGLSSGINALKSFLNTHRYTDGSFDPQPDGIDDFVDNHVIVQKRIEFWGEGLSYYDKKRRILEDRRGYVGTEVLEIARYNSVPGYTPSWFNLYFPQVDEVDRNKAIIQNPNPVPPASHLWTNYN